LAGSALPRALEERRGGRSPVAGWLAGWTTLWLAPGSAARFTYPRLDEPLEGLGYFRSKGGERPLPDIVADLPNDFLDAIRL